MDNSSPSPSAAILLAKFHLRRDAENEFAAWQAKALTRAAGFTGFLNSEITPSGDGLSWTVLLRFGTAGHLDAWRKSDAWQRLLGEAQSLLAEKSSIEIEVKETEPDGGVIEVIVTKVKSGKEAAYREWETKIQQAQSKFPGYRGSYVQPPVAGELGWTTLMRFDSATQLDRWLKSPERAALLRDAEPLIDYVHLQRMETSFPGWVPTDPASGQAPPNWKVTMLVLLGLYPIVCLEILFLMGRLGQLGLKSALAGFVGNAISVTLVAYFTMPYLVRWLNWWLLPKPDAPKSVHWKGTLVVFALYALSVAIFWKFM
jgi:uncharacterized protein